ncbi:MAG: hypothetical protein AAF772_14230 [Acidobacteriota bacterium]
MADGAFDRPTDLGPDATVVFLRVEHDLDGTLLACFATDDGATFALDAAALELRILHRTRGGRRTDVSQERRALTQLNRR